MKMDNKFLCEEDALTAVDSYYFSELFHQVKRLKHLTNTAIFREKLSDVIVKRHKIGSGGCK